jgi:hypothetical protein
MSNVAGKAYGMTVITPMAARFSWLNRWIFRFARAFPVTLAGLLGLKFIHFARWVIIPRNAWPSLGEEQEQLSRDAMLFVSNFNGTWDQYIDAFADGIPTGLDLFWYKNSRYPGSVPVTPFKDYIRANQIDCDYYYNATPGAAYRDIVSAMRVRRALLELEDSHARTTADVFAEIFRKRLLTIQNDLTTQGYSPVASTETDLAERRRQQFNRLRTTMAKAKMASLKFDGGQ